MVLLLHRLAYGLETDTHGDLGSSADGRVEAERAAEFSCALLHDGDAEVSSPSAGIRGHKAASVVPNAEAERFGIVSQADEYF